MVVSNRHEGRQSRQRHHVTINRFILGVKLEAVSINQSINQSMAVTDAGTKVPLYPYHTFYTLLVFKST